MMKITRTWILLLMFALLLLASPAAYAEDLPEIKIDGLTYTPSPAAEEKDGVLMVPLQSLANAFLADVEWEDEGETAVIRIDDDEIRMKSGELNGEKNGHVFELDTFPYLKEDTLYVPLENTVEALDAKHRYDEDENRVEIESKHYDDLPKSFTNAMATFYEADSFDYTAHAELKSGGITYKFAIFGSMHQKEKQFSVKFESAFFKGDAIFTENAIYHRSGTEEIYRKEAIDDRLETYSDSSYTIGLLQLWYRVIDDIRVTTYKDPETNEKYKKISFEIDKDGVLEIIKEQSFATEEEKAEIDEMAEAVPGVKKILDTLEVEVVMLVDDEGYVADHTVKITFETDTMGYGKMMPVTVTVGSSYANFNNAEPIDIPSDDEVYDTFKEELYFNLSRVHNAVATYHFAKGEYPTHNGNADGIIDFEKLITFQGEISASENGFSDLYAKYDEAYMTETDPPFYIEFLYSVPSSSHYVKDGTENPDAEERTVIYYLDANGQVGAQIEKEDAPGEFSEEMIYLDDLKIYSEENKLGWY